jgi:GDPmannose 4,6-dehydratase
MWMILQQPEADDYVLATGETHSVREFVERAFDHVGRPLEWHGSGAAERGIEAATGKVRIQIDPRYFRPTEVNLLIGDPSKAHQKLGWRHKTGFDALVREMVDADLQIIRTEGTRRNRHD